jgi:uncharacterized membrane protein YqjE
LLDALWHQANHNPAAQMPKKITQSQQTGRIGEVFVGYLFQSLGQKWHESKSDFGIDSHAEWRRSDTGETTGRLIGVQVKAYSGAFLPKRSIVQYFGTRTCVVAREYRLVTAPTQLYGETRVANQNTAIPEVERAVETLPSLFTRLGDQLTQLFDAKLSLLRLELKEEIAAYLRGAIMIIVGALVALIGFALLNVAIAFLISMLFDAAHISQVARYALGFTVTALLYLAVGAIVIVKAKNRINQQGIVLPRTATELQRDKEWIKNQM